MTNQQRNAQIALAALLHDIGKIEQRARDNPWRPAPGLEQEKQPEHATYSIYFIQNYVPKPFRPAALPGAYHHRPEHFEGADHQLVELVSLADHLSAGERADGPDKTKSPPMQMVTIFDRLDSSHTPPSNSELHYLPLREVSLSPEVLIPGRQASEQEARLAYTNLSEKLQQAAGQPISLMDTYLENMLLALQRYAWAVPSAYYHNLPDVSLYDHLRMTAALAVCLAEFPA